MGYHFSYRLTATLNLCAIYFKITWALSTLLEHMHKKFEIKRTKIKGSCQSGSKVVTHNSKSDLPLASSKTSTQLTEQTDIFCSSWRGMCVPIYKNLQLPRTTKRWQKELHYGRNFKQKDLCLSQSILSITTLIGNIKAESFHEVASCFFIYIYRWVW